MENELENGNENERIPGIVGAMRYAKLELEYFSHLVFWMVDFVESIPRMGEAGWLFATPQW